MSAGYNPARPVLSSGGPVRASLLLALLAVLAAPAACVGSIGTSGEFEPDPNPSAAPSSCAVDDDCVPAGLTCCGCPTFAVMTSDPVARACSNVSGPGCPPPECSENVIARCSEERRCELACKPAACEAAAQSCAYGFAADMNGCLTCACAAPEPGGCMADTDCVRTRADCCGCKQGGFDTAVLTADQKTYDATLMCPPSPACPGIETCTADEPTCVQGRCELVSPDLPAGACGRSDLPLCPEGSQCLVNVSDQANMHGVGLCGPPL
jgi:hypothetical protein